uniref:alpha-1,6-rhamnosyltransferase n=1 Tax=Pseudomonas aeruginosa TaxID=287 RepID=UPI002117C46A
SFAAGETVRARHLLRKSAPNFAPRYTMLEQLQKVHGFQLYRQQNQGVSAALNFGLQHARGDYVATPDLDDIMLPHSLSVRAAYLDQHPEVGCVGALVIYIDSEGQETKRQNGNRIRQLDFDYLLGNAYVCGAPVSLYRMEALRAAGFYDPEIKVQDFQMTLRIASQGYQIHKLPVLVTRYRRHPDNLSRRYKVLLDADLRTIAPYQSHPAYERGRTELVNKALKYAVVADKRHAWQLLRSLPLRQWNRTTFRRLKRFLLHHES